MRTVNLIGAALAKLACVSMLATASVAHGFPLTDPSQMHDGATLIDFESLPVGPTGESSLSVGDVTFSIAGQFSILDISGYAANGTEVEGHTLDPATSLLEFGDNLADYVVLWLEFAHPVSEVGLGVFDPSIGEGQLVAFDTYGPGSASGLLEQTAFGFGPPGGVYATFTGIRRPAPEIRRVQVVSSSIKDSYTIDNVRYFAIPEPPATAACVLALLPLVMRMLWGRPL